MRAEVSLIILTGIAPILLDAASKNWILIVQQNTVPMAISSPVQSMEVLFEKR